TASRTTEVRRIAEKATRSDETGGNIRESCAAPPSSVMNSRRFVAAIIRSPRRREQQRRGGLEAGHELVGSMTWQISCLGTAENFSGVDAGLMNGVSSP